jgi:hypothetical protein
VVHDETTDKLGVGVGAVLHLHDLDHVEVNGLAAGSRASSASGRGRGTDGKNSIGSVGSKLLGKLGVELGGERGEGNLDEVGAVEGGELLERVEELEESKLATE